MVFSSSVQIPIFILNFNSVIGFGIFWLGGLSFFSGILKFWGYFSGYILLAQDRNLHITDSQ